MRRHLLLLAGIVLLVLLAPVLSSHDPLRTNPDAQLQQPGSAHLLGTDYLGRDVLSRTLHGGRLTLLTAGAATLIAIIPGTLIGLLAGLRWRWLDGTVNILLNALLAIPMLMLALLFVAALGQGMLTLALATGAAQIAAHARVVRSAVLVVSQSTFVEAAYAMGARKRYIILRCILPNVLPVLLTYAAVVFSYSLLNSAALSFLGLGGEPGIPDWGSMLADGRFAFRSAPWVALAPGTAITLTIMAVNNLVDAANERA